MPNWLVVVLALGFLGGIGLTFVFQILSNATEDLEQKRVFSTIAVCSLLVGLLSVGIVVVSIYLGV